MTSCGDDITTSLAVCIPSLVEAVYLASCRTTVYSFCSCHCPVRYLSDSATLGYTTYRLQQSNPVSNRTLNCYAGAICILCQNAFKITRERNGWLCRARSLNLTAASAAAKRPTEMGSSRLEPGNMDNRSCVGCCSHSNSSGCRRARRQGECLPKLLPNGLHTERYLLVLSDDQKSPRS